jgi:hypothetical protein
MARPNSFSPPEVEPSSVREHRDAGDDSPSDADPLPEGRVALGIAGRWDARLAEHEEAPEQREGREAIQDVGNRVRIAAGCRVDPQPRVESEPRRPGPPPSRDELGEEFARDGMLVFVDLARREERSELNGQQQRRDGCVDQVEEILCSYTSVILVMLLGQSRVFDSMSRDGLVPKACCSSSLWRRSRPSCRLKLVGNPNEPRPFRAPWMPVVPILGILFNLAQMYSPGKANWLRLIVWPAIGQVIYFAYGRRHSRLTKEGRL